MILKVPVLQPTAELMAAAKIPRSFWSHQVSEIPAQNQEELRAVLRLLPDRLDTGRGLMVCGQFAVGKTSFACMLLRKAISYSADCLFMYAVEMGELWYKDSDDGRQYADRFRSADLLVIDDIGQEGDNQVMKRLEFLIRRRYDDRRVTVVTTNFTPPQLMQRYSAISRSVFRRVFVDVLVLAGATI